MANRIFDDADIQNIANAIREKNGSSNTYLVSEMGDAIRDIPIPEPKLGTLEVTENGVYKASEIGGGEETFTVTVDSEFTATEFGNAHAIKVDVPALDLSTIDPDTQTIDLSAFKDWSYKLTSDELNFEVDGSYEFPYHLDADKLKSVWFDFEGFAFLRLQDGTMLALMVPSNIEEILTVMGLPSDVIPAYLQMFPPSTVFLFDLSSTRTTYSNYTVEFTWRSAGGEALDGFSEVVVNVPTSEPTPTQEKNHRATANGSIEILPDDGYALSKVTVTVDTPVVSAGDFSKYINGSLIDVVIPSDVTYISDYAFTKKPIKSVQIHDNVSNMGKGVFQDCTSLTTVTLPAKFMGGSTPTDLFNGCTSLTSVYIPEGFRSVPDNAFRNCDSLTELTFPSTTAEVRQWGISGCDKLTKVTFQNDDIELGVYAFRDNPKLTDIITPKGFRYVSGQCFYNCRSLVNVKLHESLTRISTGAFGYCMALTNIQLPAGLTHIESEAFYYCENLDITIPETVTAIGQSAFSHSGITNLVIPSSVTSLGSGVFVYCNNLTSAVYNSSTNVPDGTFQYCPNLNSVEINNCTSIGGSAFTGCSSLTSVTLGDTVTTIGGGAFSSCTGLISMEFGDNISSIGSSCFAGCSNLTSVVFGNGISSIQNYAFQNCEKLNSVDIGSGITNIGNYAFYGCRGLQSLTVRAETPPTLGGSWVFDYVPSTCVFYVPASAVETYKKTSNWASYASRFQPIPE